MLLCSFLPGIVGRAGVATRAPKHTHIERAYADQLPHLPNHLRSAGAEAARPRITLRKLQTDLDPVARDIARAWANGDANSRDRTGGIAANGAGRPGSCPGIEAAA